MASVAIDVDAEHVTFPESADIACAEQWRYSRWR